MNNVIELICDSIDYCNVNDIELEKIRFKSLINNTGCRFEVYNMFLERISGYENHDFFEIILHRMIEYYGLYYTLKHISLSPNTVSMIINLFNLKEYELFNYDLFFNTRINAAYVHDLFWRIDAYNTALLNSKKNNYGNTIYERRPNALKIFISQLTLLRPLLLDNKYAIHIEIEDAIDKYSIDRKRNSSTELTVMELSTLYETLKRYPEYAEYYSESWYDELISQT